MKKIILASSSPRRREILEKYNVDFEIMTSNINEKISFDEDPFQVAMSLAFQKAEDISKRIHFDAIVIAADTIVYMDKVIGKPKDEADAYKILESLSGKEHLVITGISIIDVILGKKIIDYENSVIVPDIRLPHELELFKKHGAISIRVESSREARANRGTLVKEDDTTEVALDNVKDWDYVIENNSGLEELTSQVEKIADDIRRKIA